MFTHEQVGPQLLYFHPPEVAAIQRQFEALSDYVIVDKNLCGQIISVRTEEVYFMNYPIALSNPKYGRNTLFFSFGFVLELQGPKVAASCNSSSDGGGGGGGGAWDDTGDVEPYESVLQKISQCFVGAEVIIILY